MEKENVLDKTIYDFSKKSDIIQTIILGLLAFLVPTFLAQFITTVFGTGSVITLNSQIIVGSIVNMALILAAINIKGWKKIIAIITMPSISTILSGYVFQAASVYMVYMIPAIWIGNFILIYSFKFFMLNKNYNYFIASIICIITKVLVIFGWFELLNLLGIFPSQLIQNLQTAMGLTQLITATIGSILVFMIYHIEKKKFTNIN